jgi:hypothetical protein
VDDDSLEQLPALPNDDDLVPSATVKEEFGKISDMTVWRWTRNPRVQFPLTDFVINGRRYWTRRTLRRHRQHLKEMESRA